MKRTVIIACLTSVVIAAGVLAADDSTNAPPMPPRPMRPMMRNILPPRILEELALTADQQTKYNSLDASFKSDVAKLQANNAPPGGPTTNAPPSGGREAFRDPSQELRRKSARLPDSGPKRQTNPGHGKWPRRWTSRARPRCRWQSAAAATTSPKQLDSAGGIMRRAGRVQARAAFVRRNLATNAPSTPSRGGNRDRVVSSANSLWDLRNASTTPSFSSGSRLHVL